jgi:hypothetical protein
MKHLSATYKGMVTAVIMIAASLIFFYIFDLPVNGKSQYVILLIFVAGVLWSMVSYRMTRGTVQDLKSYFSEGFKTFIVVTLFMAAYTFIFYKLNPQIMENGIQENNALLLKDGNKTMAEIEDNADQLRSIFMPMMLAINTMKYLLLGSLVSVLAGGFLMRKIRT